jgi:hypothetical protein
MIIDILTHTPLWVWGILAALVVLGLQQTRDRQLSPTRLTVLPVVFIGLSLSGVLRFPGIAPLAIGAWACGFACVALLLRRALAVPRARWSVETQTVAVPGSWLPLVLIVGLFLMKYGVGVTLAMHPEQGSDPTFSAVYEFVYGLFAGLFWFRSRSVRAVVPARNAASAVALRQNPLP